MTDQTSVGLTGRILTLRFSADIAAALGGYVAEFASLEHMLELLLGMLLDIGKGLQPMNLPPSFAIDKLVEPSLGA